jgi:hypothetical protein
MIERIQQVKALAEKATPGPWEVDDSGEDGADGCMVNGPDCMIAECNVHDNWMANAAFIAACDPEFIAAWATEHAALVERVNDLLGIGPGESTPANYSHCTDCGRAMVYNRKPGEQGPGSSWMCPRCVMERARALEKERDALRAAVLWALGQAGDFAHRPEGAGLYWWRTELRRRAALDRALGGEVATGRTQAQCMACDKVYDDPLDAYNCCGKRGGYRPYVVAALDRALSPGDDARQGVKT